jgi:Fe-S-cluster-containing dehydrogenase component/formate-dependent nitrite reductase membrane component NrfD
VEKGAWPDTKRFFTVMRCNHCTDAPCVAICPTRALRKRQDGIVDFDTDLCIGCKSCMQACPYDSLYIDPDEKTAQKCNYCVHRVSVGLEPACVVVCPEHAIVAGDLDNPGTELAQLVRTRQTTVRAAEQGTGPNLFYLGADQANLDPLGATTLHDGGIWREPASAGSFMAVDLTPKPNGSAPGGVVKDHDAVPPRVVYNTDHPAPWGWRVSAYFLTKGIAAGLAVALAMALLFGATMEGAWMQWGTPLVAAVFLALTAVLLVWDLKRPDRFHYLILKGNPGSWLVRGAYILTAYAAVLGVWFLAGVFGADGMTEVLAWVAVPLGLATAGYTAFLFGQAEARDLWQSPVLLWHMLAGAFAAGGGVALIASLFFDVGEQAERGFAWTMVIGAGALGLIALVELATPHPTRNIEAAMHHMTRGHFAAEWWLGGQAVGVMIPVVLGIAMLAGGALWLGALGGIAAAAGIWFADNAFVKAGQSVPLS